MNIPRVSVIGTALLALAATAAAGAEPKRPITAADLWAFKRLGQPALSPDGRAAVVAVQEWSVDKNKSTTNLWWVELAGGHTRRLTSATANDTAPAMSPEGTRVAFVSKRGDDEADALYVLRLDGGEAEKVVGLPYAVRSPRWLPDGRRIVFVTQVQPGLAGKLGKEDLAAMRREVKRRKDARMTARVTDDRQYRYWDHPLTDGLANRLVKVDVETKALTDLTPRWDRPFHMIGDASIDVAPDGRHVAAGLNSTSPPYRETPNLDIYLIDTDGSGTMRNLTAENPFTDEQPRFSPDGKSILFLRTSRSMSGSENRRLWRHDLATGTNAALTEAIDKSFESFAFSPDGRSLWAVAENRGAVPLWKMKVDGTGLSEAYARGTASGLDARGGAIVFLNETFDRPAELFAFDAKSGSARQLTHFNDALLASLELGKVESREFAGANGDTVQMWLVYPPDYDPAQKYPLVQLLHGGPHTMARDAFSYRWNAHVFAAPGYFVCWVNRHGSTGFGEAFAASIDGEWGDKPLADVLGATDELIAKIPGIDASRLAAAGGSYGGYLAAWMLGHTDRFRCLVDHAGVVDFNTQYGADMTSYVFTDRILGGTPWKNVEGMQRNNPISYASHFKTPTLLIHGEMDYRVPYGNALELYGVLQAMNVPSRLVLYPNENHWVLTPQNSIYWNYEVQQWLARYIGGHPMEKPRFESEEEER